MATMAAFASFSTRDPRDLEPSNDTDDPVGSPGRLSDGSDDGLDPTVPTPSAVEQRCRWRNAWGRYRRMTIRTRFHQWAQICYYPCSSGVTKIKE